MTAKKRMTRKEKIEAIGDAMSRWDAGILIDWAIHQRKEQLKKLTDKELNAVYRGDCLGE